MSMFKESKFWKTAILAWVIFIGIDFFFHAAVFAQLWSEKVESFKTQAELFRLIPAGYGSFLLLTILIIFTFNQSFDSAPSFKRSVTFSLVFGLLFSVSYFLGLYSFLRIPASHLAAFSMVYFIEIFGVCMISHFSKMVSFRKLTLFTLSVFFFLIIIGILIQNLSGNLP